MSNDKLSFMPILSSSPSPYEQVRSCVNAWPSSVFSLRKKFKSEPLDNEFLTAAEKATQSSKQAASDIYSYLGEQVAALTIRANSQSCPMFIDGKPFVPQLWMSQALELHIANTVSSTLSRLLHEALSDAKATGLRARVSEKACENVVRTVSVYCGNGNGYMPRLPVFDQVRAEVASHIDGCLQEHLPVSFTVPPLAFPMHTVELTIGSQMRLMPAITVADEHGAETIMVKVQTKEGGVKFMPLNDFMLSPRYGNIQAGQLHYNEL